MKLFITLSKKSLLIILMVIIIAIIILGQFFTIKGTGIDGSTNASRMEFIESLGYTADDSSPSVKEITIPQKFSDVYKKYNQLQQLAGFDLSEFKGEKAFVYTYKLKDNTDMNINIIICKNRIIGGDISSVVIDGEMNPLIKSDLRKDNKSVATS